MLLDFVITPSATPSAQPRDTTESPPALDTESRAEIYRQLEFSVEHQVDATQRVAVDRGRLMGFLDWTRRLSLRRRASPLVEVATPSLAVDGVPSSAAASTPPAAGSTLPDRHEAAARKCLPDGATLREFQRDFVAAASVRRRDTCLVAPTASGKTLALLFHSLVADSVTLFIGPLREPLRQQCQQGQKMLEAVVGGGAYAHCTVSDGVFDESAPEAPDAAVDDTKGASAEFVTDVLAGVRKGSLEHRLLHDRDLRQLFTTPERLVHSQQLEVAVALSPRLSHVVVDELHLLVDWDDFREALRRLRLLLARIRRRRRDAGLPPLTFVAATATATHHELPRMAEAAGLAPGFERVVARSGFERREIAILVAFEAPEMATRGSQMQRAVAGVRDTMSASGLDVAAPDGGATLAFVRYASAAGAAANALAEICELRVVSYTGKMDSGLQRLALDALLDRLNLAPADAMEDDEGLPKPAIAALEGLAREHACRLRVLGAEDEFLFHLDGKVARGKYAPPTFFLRHRGGGRLDADAAATTCAFGTGLDLPREVRRVLHLGPPPSLRAYYQEIGRLARQGGASIAIMILSADLIGETLSLVVSGTQHGEGRGRPSDAAIHQALASFVELMAVLLLPGCRRRRLLAQLVGGAPERRCHACDRCNVFGGCGRAVEQSIDGSAAMLVLAEHLHTHGSVLWGTLCSAAEPPTLPAPFHSTAARLQLVLFALILGVARLEPALFSPDPRARRGVIVALEPAAMRKLERGMLTGALLRLPISHASHASHASPDTGPAAPDDALEAALERLRRAHLAKHAAIREEELAMCDYLQQPGADASALSAFWTG